MAKDVTPPQDEQATNRFDPDDRLTVRGLVAGQDVFGRFKLEAVAGRGGMGVVWKANDLTLGEMVALKFLPEVVACDVVAIDELKEETRHARRLTHPHIVRIHDFLQDEQRAAVSMEFVTGTTLAQMRLDQPGKVFSAEKLAPLVTQLCAALDYAHNQARIVHRDLKPANLLMTADGQLKVTDFGIARSLSETHTRITGKMSGATSGTLTYMSPQQLAGEKPTVADDLYALGATLYELLTGKPPFHRGDAFSLMKQISERAPLPLSAQRVELEVAGDPIPADWEDTILACLAKEPRGRPDSIGEVAARLGLGRITPLADGDSPPVRRIKLTPTRRLKFIWLAGAALIVAAVVLIWPKSVAQKSTSDASTPAPKQSTASYPRQSVAAKISPVPLAAPREFTVTVDPANVSARLWIGPLSDLPVTGGRAVIKDLPDGEHELMVRAPGYQPFSTRVTLKDGRGSAEARMVSLKGAPEEASPADSKTAAADKPDPSSQKLPQSDTRQVEVASRVLEMAGTRNWPGLEAALTEWESLDGTIQPALHTAVDGAREMFVRWLALQNAWRALRDAPPPPAKRISDLAPVWSERQRLAPAALLESRRIIETLDQLGDHQAATEMAGAAARAAAETSANLVAKGRLAEAKQLLNQIRPFEELSLDERIKSDLMRVRDTLMGESRREQLKRLDEALTRGDLGGARATRTDITAAEKAGEIALPPQGEGTATLRRLEGRLDQLGKADEAESRAQRLEASGDLAAAAAAILEGAAAFDLAGSPSKAEAARSKADLIKSRIAERQVLESAISTLDHAELAIRNQMAGRKDLSRSNAKKWGRWLDDFERKNSSLLAIREELRVRLKQLRQFIAENTSTSIFS